MEVENNIIARSNRYNDNSNIQLSVICDADTLRTLIRKKTVRVVDVRKVQEYEGEHIPTAVSLPLAQLLAKNTPSEIVECLASLGISDKMPVVVYDDTFGALAARVAWTFQYVGHDNTALLETTFSQWKELGLETEKQSRHYPRSHHKLNLNKSIFADAPYVESAKSEQDKIVVDSRERLNF